MFFELARLAVGNMARARARLMMTAGGVLVGTTAVILLIALTFGLQQAAESSIGQNQRLTQLQVYPNYSNFNPSDPSSMNVPQLDTQVVRALWQIPGVAVVVPIKNLQRGELLADKYLGYAQIMGIDTRLLPYLGITMEQGELALESGDVLVGPYVNSYFYDPQAENYEPIEVDLLNSRVRLQLSKYNALGDEVRRIDLNVRGVLAAGTDYDYTVIMPIQDVISYNDWLSDQETDMETFIFDQITVITSSREATNDVATAIRKLGLSASGIGDFLNQLNGFFTTMRLMLGGVGGVALLVAAFGVANTMTMAILERTKEIGLMKAIGATDQDVLVVFLVEAGLVGSVGGIAGVGLSLFLQNLVNQAIQNAPSNPDSISFLPIDPSQIGGNLLIIPPELAVFAIVLATLVGLGAGLYPALRAAHLPPVIALKQE